MKTLAQLFAPVALLFACAPQHAPQATIDPTGMTTGMVDQAMKQGAAGCLEMGGTPLWCWQCAWCGLGSIPNCKAVLLCLGEGDVSLTCESEGLHSTKPDGNTGC